MEKMNEFHISNFDQWLNECHFNEMHKVEPENRDDWFNLKGEYDEKMGDGLAMEFFKKHGYTIEDIVVATEVKNYYDPMHHLMKKTKEVGQDTLKVPWQKSAGPGRKKPGRPTIGNTVVHYFDEPFPFVFVEYKQKLTETYFLFPRQELSKNLRSVGASREFGLSEGKAFKTPGILDSIEITTPGGLTKVNILPYDIYRELVDKIIEECKKHVPSGQRFDFGTGIKYLVYRTPADQGRSHIPEDEGSYIDTVQSLSRADGENILGTGKYTPVKFTHVIGISIENVLISDELLDVIRAISSSHKMIPVFEKAGYFSNDWTSTERATELVLFPEKMRGHLHGKKFGI